MLKQYSLRRFKLSDLKNVISINRRCLPENYSEYFFKDIYERYPETFIVCEINGEIVGYIMCRIEYDMSPFKLRSITLQKKAHIISIAVLYEHQSKGIGFSLINEALNAGKNFYSTKSCFLEVRVTNAKAINLYKKIGFQIKKTFKRYYVDGEDAYMMMKELSN
jgi:ribosomal-protein-alanine N-acetyltransferase